jgi:uncharacterized protein (TIGR01244 family)
MSDFRKLSDSVWASPQIHAEDVHEAHKRGFAMIINNRPDDEVDGQPTGADIAALADELGLAYHAIPITPGSFGPAEVTLMVEALESADGPVLAYCRSGTRSTLLWSLAQAAGGRDPEEIASAAAAAGYDITPVRPLVDQLAAHAND